MNDNTSTGNHLQLEHPEQVAGALKKLKTYKSAGAENVVTEMLVATRDAETDILHKLYHLI